MEKSRNEKGLAEGERAATSMTDAFLSGKIHAVKPNVNALIAEGDAFLQEERYSDARARYRAATQTAPGDYRAWLGLFGCETENFRNLDSDRNGFLKQGIACVLEGQQKKAAETLAEYYETLTTELRCGQRFFDPEAYYGSDADALARDRAQDAEKLDLRIRWRDLSLEEERLQKTSEEKKLFARLGRKSLLRRLERVRQERSDTYAKINELKSREYTMADAIYDKLEYIGLEKLRGVEITFEGICNWLTLNDWLPKGEKKGYYRRQIFGDAPDLEEEWKSLQEQAEMLREIFL